MAATKLAMRFPVIPTLLVCCAGLAHANLLTNGDFDTKAESDGEVPGWSLSASARLQQVWVDGASARTGAGCLAVRSLRTTKEPAVVSQRAAVEPHSRYALSLWAKRDSFVYGTEFRVVLREAGQQVDLQSAQFRGADWAPVTMCFDSGEADTAEIQLATPNTGTWRITIGRTLWVDDVQLAKIDPADNLVLTAAAAPVKQGCEPHPDEGALGGQCLSITAGGTGSFGFEIAPKKTGQYYLWMRATCPGENLLAVQTADGTAWQFRSQTPATEWRWVRPILPELLLNEGTQQLNFAAEGEGLAVDQVVLTMDPFWQPEGAADFRPAVHAIASQRKSAPEPERRGAVELSVLGAGRARPWAELHWPLSQCVPFPRGALRDAGHVRLIDANGVPLLCQPAAFTRWPDGSVKWLLLSTFAPTDSRCRLEYGTELEPAASSSRLRVSEDSKGVALDTGALRLLLGRGGSPLIQGVWIDSDKDGTYSAEEQVVESGYLRANRTFRSTGQPPELTIEERGPVRVTVKVTGAYGSPVGKLMDYVLRLHAYAGADFVTVEHTFLRRDGETKIALDDVSLVLTLPESRPLTELLWQEGDRTNPVALAGETATLVSRLSSDPQKPNDYPYTVRVGQEEVWRGARYPGMVRAFGPTVALGACVRRFWENSPKSFSVSPRQFEVGLIAPGERVEFFKGMAKTHEVMLSFGTELASLQCFAEKPLLVASPEWYCSTKAFDAFPEPRTAGAFANYERCVDDTLARWLKAIGDSALKPGAGGMIHAGDYGGGSEFMNLESALGEGLMVQFFRTGRRDLFDQADASLNHFSDIDVDHSGENAGLLYGHGPHGREVTDLMAEGVNGHSWFNGVTYYGLLTGSRRIVEQAAEVGHFYARHAVPPQPYLHYWRQVAWKLMDLMCAYDLTGDPTFLEAARRDVLLTRHQRDHVVTLWPYLCGVGLKALRHYYDVTGDPEARELHLQMMDSFLRLRERPGDTINGESQKLPGMLLGNFPNDRSCAFYNELAQAYFLTGGRGYAELGAGDLDWQVKFGVNDPTLLWGSADLVRAMHERSLSEPVVVQTLPLVYMNQPSGVTTPLPPHTRPTVYLQVVEASDQDFTISLFKGCYSKYTTNYHSTATLYDPEGQVVGRQRAGTEGLRELKFAVPKDAKTGVYTVEVALDYVWRWSLEDVAFELAPGDHVLKVASRYDQLCLDQLLLVPGLTYFPSRGGRFPEGSILFEAENGRLADGYEGFENPAASERLYVRSAVSRNAAAISYPFSVPRGEDPTGKRTYRLFARLWKPAPDLLTAAVDDQPTVELQQLHDMDANTFPLWSVATSLGDGAVGRYWETDEPGKPSRYSAKYLKAEGLLGKRR